jgi:elongation factor 3
MAGSSNNMPDLVASPSLPILVKPVADRDKVSQLLSTIVATDNAQLSVNTAYDLTDLLLNSVGPSGLASYNLLDFTRKAASDKKDEGKRQGAMFIAGAFFERFPPKQPLAETVFFVQHADWLYVTLDALADRNVYVREAAQYALNELPKLKAESLAVGLLPALIGYLSKKAAKWQGFVGAFAMIESLATKAIKADDEGLVLRDALGKRLEALIPHVEAGMHDLKSEVRRSVLLFGQLLI